MDQLRYAVCLVTIAATVALLSHPAASQPVRIIDRFAGGSNGDGGPATGASLTPVGTAVDNQGNVFVADQVNNRVRRIDAATGIITTVAGNGTAGDTGDGGPAEEASLNLPADVDVDDAGNVFIADQNNHKIRRVDAVTGIIKTIAGNGTPGFSGDGQGPATQAQLHAPVSVAVGSEGSVYISDSRNLRIRRVFPAGGIETYAGQSGGFRSPWALTIDNDENLYITDVGFSQVLRVDTNREITSFAGSSFGLCENAVPAETCFRNPLGIGFDEAANAIVVADTGNHLIRSVPLSGGIVTTIAGVGSVGIGIPGYNGDDQPAVLANLNGPRGVDAHPSRGVFIADEGNGRLRLVDRSATPQITTIAGNGNLPYGGDGGAALSAKLQLPNAVATDFQGNVFISDSANRRIRKVDSNLQITTFAGNGDPGSSGDGGQATQATLTFPAGLAADSLGNVYIADSSAHVVRRVAPSGIITRILGTGHASSSGDGGTATSATTLRPAGLAVYENPSGTQRYLYVAEPSSNKIRRVDLNANVVHLFAGTGTFGYNGEGSPATSKQLAVPSDVATDAAGNVYIADQANNRIRRVSGNTITTVAGNGNRGFSGDGGLAISASLAGPESVDVDSLSNIFIEDTGNVRIRVVTTDGNIQTAAGTGSTTGSIDGEGGNPNDDLGDGGPATQASFSRPAGLAIDPAGNLFIADSFAHTVRWIEDLSSLYDMGPPTGALFGAVRHATTLQAIPGVDVNLIGPTTLTATTSGSGAYSANGLQAATWLAEPEKSLGFGAGAIDSLDAMFVLEDLVNVRNLSSAQKLACDVTGNGSLSALDAAKILKRATGMPITFAAAANCQSDWLFIPNPAAAQNMTKIQPLLSPGTCRMGALQYSPLAGMPDGQDFHAVVIGDCTGNWNDSGGAQAGLSGMSGRRGGGTILVGAARQRRGRVLVPITVNSRNGFKALDIKVRFDANTLRPRRVHKRGAANGSLLAWHETKPGELKIAMASGTSMTTPARYAIVIDMDATDEPGRRSVLRSVHARIDGENARVRMRRGKRQRR